MGRTETEETKESKVYKKAVKLLGAVQAREVTGKTYEELKEIVAQCEIYKKKAKDEVENTSEYERAAENLKALKAGLRDAVAPYEAKKKLALSVLSEK